MDKLTPKRSRGRPRSAPSQHVMVRMTPDLVTRIDTYTTALQSQHPGLHVSRADAIRTICERFLHQQDMVREEPSVYKTSKASQRRKTVKLPLPPTHVRVPISGMRQSIIELLRQYPEGLSSAEVKRHLNVDKDLGNTLKAMVRDRFLIRGEIGRYILSEDVSSD